MFINNFDPVAFQILSLEIRWYSLAYIVGILLGWLFCKKKLFKDDIVSNLFDEYITYVILGMIIGGRLGYILFYNLNYYLENLFEVFAIWNGGMSFHGAVIGIIITSLFFSNKKNINHFIFLDFVSLSAPIGIFFGRIANFINSELYGRPTEVAWSVKFEVIDNINRHPSQLYEAFFEGLILFFILIFFRNKGFMKIPGFISGLFLIFYSIFRFLLEFVRVPDEHLGYLLLDLTMGQLISLIFLLIGIYLLVTKNENKNAS